MKVKYAAALGIALAALAVNPAEAHADPSGYFLDCITNHGYVITDAAQAIHLGRLIQLDELNDLPRSQIISNLIVRWGADPYQANIYVDCAYHTLTDS
jgi:hypothetical protein